MTRLLDIGLERIKNLLIDMSLLSETTVNTAIESYEKGIAIRSKIFDHSEKLRLLQLEIADFAIELIARYQPVATDLRFLQSCLDISYGFMRFGRYAYDISEVLETIGPSLKCDTSTVSTMALMVKDMIRLSLDSLRGLDKDISPKLYVMDDSVDSIYRNFLHKTFKIDSGDVSTTISINDMKCYVSTLLILRYLERISDHACYIGDCVHYIVTGDPTPRK